MAAEVLSKKRADHLLHIDCGLPPRVVLAGCLGTQHYHRAVSMVVEGFPKQRARRLLHHGCGWQLSEEFCGLVFASLMPINKPC